MRAILCSTESKVRHTLYVVQAARGTLEKSAQDITERLK